LGLAVSSMADFGVEFAGVDFDECWFALRVRFVPFYLIYRHFLDYWLRRLAEWLRVMRRLARLVVNIILLNFHSFLFQMIRILLTHYILSNRTPLSNLRLKMNPLPPSQVLLLIQWNIGYILKRHISFEIWSNISVIYNWIILVKTEIQIFIRRIQFMVKTKVAHAIVLWFGYISL